MLRLMKLKMDCMQFTLCQRNWACIQSQLNTKKCIYQVNNIWHHCCRCTSKCNINILNPCLGAVCLASCDILSVACNGEVITVYANSGICVFWDVILCGWVSDSFMF